VARVDPTWTFKKGSEGWAVEQIRLSPAPKLGGWAGKQLRFLSVSRGQSILTDVQHGSLAINRRVTGLPSMQRMWFSPHGHSLGYTKPRGSAGPPELFFFDSDARLCAQQRLPAATADASAGPEQWFVGCRDGRVYAFSFDGWRLWRELIPNARRDNATNELWGLPVFHPRLHLAADGPVLAIGAEHEFHHYDTSGERLWSGTLPSVQQPTNRRTESADLPSREDRLSRLGLAQAAGRDQVRTGYVRLALDTLLSAGWLKQVQAYDIECVDDTETSVQPKMAFEIGFPWFEPGICVIRTCWNVIAAGVQNGLVHVFDWDGSLKETFQVGEAAVADLLVTPAGLRAAYCAGQLTVFSGGRISAVTELPEYFAELSDCGDRVLAWKSNSVWVVEDSGRVQLAAETDRPIRGAWGHSNGFYVLAGGELSSFQVRSIDARRGRKR
jgi:hypothetical protein